jgi:hypothetical protein
MLVYPGLGQSEVDMCDRTDNIFRNSAAPFSEFNNTNRLIWFKFISVALLFSSVLSYDFS